MLSIPKEYPLGLSDDELIKLVKDFSIYATEAGRPGNYVVGPSYWKEMAELGQNELSNRIQRKLLIEIINLKEEISKLKEDNEKSGRINKRLNIITIFLAIITGIIGFLSLYVAWPEKRNGDFQSLYLKEIRSNGSTLKDIFKILDESQTKTITGDSTKTRTK